MLKSAGLTALVMGLTVCCARAFADEPALATIPVQEQSAQADKPAAKEDTGTTQLESVVVTATKRKKSLREIPESIDEFNGARLESEGKFNIVDYIQEKPGVTMTTIAPNLNKISIRGIGTDAYPGSPLSSGTGILIGDTSFGDPFITNIQPDFSAFDLQSVEILKGPQGTLFGGAALAGAIRYVLQEPVLGEWQARAFGQYVAPTDGTPVFSEGGIVNVPIGDTFAARFGYVRHKYPGIVDSVLRDMKDVDGTTGNQYRGLLAWRPIDALDVKFSHIQEDTATPNATPLVDSPNGPRQTSLKILPQPSDTRFGLDSLELGYDFGPVRATALASRTFKDWHLIADATAAITGPPNQPPGGLPLPIPSPLPLPGGLNTETGSFEVVNDDSKSISEELRLQSTSNHGLQWLVGVFNIDYKVFFEILDDTIANRDANQAAGTPTDVYRESSLFYGVTNVKAHERAVFFDLGYKFWDHLDLTAGARLYQTEVKGGFAGVGSVARLQNQGQDFNYSDHDIAEKGVSPKLTATFNFSRDVATYFSASRGFRFGGLQSVPSSSMNGVPPQYKSDKLWNYEIGLRTSWLGNTLHFDNALFYIDWKDPQIALRTAQSPPLAYLDNIGHAISRGCESSLVWLTPLGVRLELAGGLTDAHITVPFTAPDPTSSSGQRVVPAGSKMPGTAKSQYAAALNYVTPQIGPFNIGARVDYHYVGKGWGDIIEVHPINDYGTLNAGITLMNATWRLKPQLALNVSNITNVTAATFGASVKPVVGNLYDLWYLNPPRTITARLALEF